MSSTLSPLVSTALAPRVVVADPVMRELYTVVERIAATDLSVLVLGETGTGKEVVARAIHTGSRRRSMPFVCVNCAALTPGLIESELFGHVRGAFTGAMNDRAGVIESASGGTLFFDEIGDLPADVQASLLRVLEDRQVTRVGGSRSVAVDVRFVFATHRNLPAAVAAGSFRADLFFRIDGVRLYVPPLRQRRAEIGRLASHFAALACAREGRPAMDITGAAREVLEGHDWPGNVRELRNAIDRAVVLASGAAIEAHDLDLGERAPRSSGTFRIARGARAAERARIVEALRFCGGNQTKAAEVLGICRRTLVHRLDEFDLPRPRRVPAAR